MLYIRNIKSSKGVVINTETLVNHVRLVVKEAVLPMYRDDKWFMPLPLYHIYAFTFLFHIMAVGTTLCLTPSPRYLVQAAHLFNPQVALLVPSMVELLIKKPELLPDLKAIITGGGALQSRSRRHSTETRDHLSERLTVLPNP